MRVILNPAAGGGDGGSGEWRAVLEGTGDAEIVEAASPGDVERAAAAALEEGVELVVAAGGDGTVNQVAAGLLPGLPPGADALPGRSERAPPGDRPVLGVIPLGTANDFARSLGVPEDPAEAVRTLLEAEIRNLDVVRVEGPAEEGAGAGRRRSRVMLNAAVGGVAGKVGERVDAERKRRWGALAYLRTAAEELPELPTYSLRAELDGEEVAMDVHHVIVANGRRTGGDLPVAPEAFLDDGVADVILIPVMDVPEMLSLAPAILTGRHLEGNRIRWRRVRAASFTADPPLPFSLDGEPFARGPVTFRVLAGALGMICGQGEDRAFGGPPERARTAVGAGGR